MCAFWLRVQPGKFSLGELLVMLSFKFHQHVEAFCATKPFHKENVKDMKRVCVYVGVCVCINLFYFLEIKIK